MSHDKKEDPKQIVKLYRFTRQVQDGADRGRVHTGPSCQEAELRGRWFLPNHAGNLIVQ